MEVQWRILAVTIALLARPCTALGRIDRAPVFRGTPGKIEIPVPNLKEPASDEFNYKDEAGMFIMGVSFLGFIGFIILVIYEAKSFISYRREYHMKASFFGYLGHRFAHWYAQHDNSAVVVLTTLTVLLINVGAVLYWLLVGQPPWRAIFHAWVWASKSKADHETTLLGRTIGISVGIGGIIILGLLITFVLQMLNRVLHNIERGDNDVLEGGHILIIGMTSYAETLIQQLAKTVNDKRGTAIVLLDTMHRHDEAFGLLKKPLLKKFLSDNNSELMVRCGEGTRADFQKVCAQSAGLIVVLADTNGNLAREEADAKSMVTLQCLKKELRCKCDIVVACWSEANLSTIESLDRGYEGTIKAVGVNAVMAHFMAPMVQGEYQPEMYHILRHIIDSNDHGWKIEEVPELTGTPFYQASLYLPMVVLVGVYKDGKNGTPNICPDGDCIIEEGDKLIMITSNESKIHVVKESCHQLDFKYHALGLNATPLSETPKIHSAKASKILLVGWNRHARSTLNTLIHNLSPNSEVHLWGDGGLQKRIRDVEGECVSDSGGFVFERDGKRIALIDAHSDATDETKGEIHITVKVFKQHPVYIAARFNLESQLTDPQLHEYDSIIVLADNKMNRWDAELTDAKNVMMLLHMQDIIELRTDDDALPVFFSPTVEVNDMNARQILEQRKICKLVNAAAIIASCICHCINDDMAHHILTGLVSESPEFHVTATTLHHFLSGDEELLDEVSFADIVAYVFRQSNMIPIGWTVPWTSDVEDLVDVERCRTSKSFEINPKDKQKKRKWTSEDLLVVMNKS